ncbi:MAG: cyclic nucleotide-binding domain-containing protein [Bdellovibrionaceae bacterium]|nr:cyclic nucleotide-binding domain-containing protein [Pseudobdellovibrionaceae bacterium]
MNLNMHISDKAKLKRISNIEIIRQLPSEDILALLPFLKYYEYPADTQLIKQGDHGDYIYFIDKGSVKVTQEDSGSSWEIGEGGVVGEISVITGELRTASVRTLKPVGVWVIDKKSFLQVIEKTHSLKIALDDLIKKRKSGQKIKALLSPAAWTGRALRSIEVKKQGLHGWQIAMFIGLLGWITLKTNNYFSWFLIDEENILIACVKLVFGFLILQGACEALVTGAERVGSRLNWDGFISGTVGSILSTLPEFVVIWFLVQIDPLMAIVTSIVTIFNNSIAYSFYAFLLPKDETGTFKMPKSLTVAGGELLIAGAAVSLILGLVMLVMHITKVKSELAGGDLIMAGVLLIVIYAYYFLTLIRYYKEGEDNPSSLPPNPERTGYDKRVSLIFFSFLVGIIGSYCGGEAVGEFAETALKHTNLGTISTSAILAFFAGISEYIIVYKSHKRGELGIALSNVFGGMTQVMFLLLPFGLIIIGAFGVLGYSGNYYLQINPVTLLLFLLLFPLFYTLYQYFGHQNKVSNLGAAGMSGIYILLLYFLFTLPI